MPKKQTKKFPLYRKKPFVWTICGLVGFVLLVLLAFRLSPWPGAMVVRAVFERGGHKTLVALQKDVSAQPVAVLADQQYGKANHKEALDVYIPQSAMQTDQTLPVIIWTHGGAWLSGDKAGAAPYYKMLANQGFVVVSLNYSLAPEKTYPTPLHQLNDAYTYIQTNATRFHANINKIVLAGDSAGSQLSSQMAAIITDVDYAKEVGIEPALAPPQLAGVVLFCGIYKMEGLTHPDPTLPKIVSWGSDISVWAYLGTRDKSGPLVRQASPYYHVTKAFPPTFISGGNGDSLTNAQSVPLASKLKSLNVPTTTLFYPQNHAPSLPHEYQFTLNADGKNAFTQMTQFLKEKTQ
ncbi:MAG TPA: alpha/beta hydrolase [Nevskiaceae bacterium]|nr:alpha/beta hydrolase [Nevskiaceae bacterium]